MRRSRARPRDDHYALVNEASYRAVGLALRTFHEESIDHVLVGGWAVFAYGSPVPSIDTDIFLRREDGPRFRTALRRVDPEALRNIDLLDLEATNTILGPDFEFGDPDLGFAPEVLFQGRTRGITFSPPGGAVTGTVPEPAELAFTKLKALHDRTLAWNALRDPGVMACIPPADRPSIRAKTEGYYYRKASKDLYDIAFLVAHASPIGQALAIAERFGLRSRLEAAWHAPHRRLLRFAADMVEQDEGTLAALRRGRPSPGEA